MVVKLFELHWLWYYGRNPPMSAVGKSAWQSVFPANTANRSLLSSRPDVTLFTTAESINRPFCEVMDCIFGN
jgi:hypothetical protein